MNRQRFPPPTAAYTLPSTTVVARSLSRLRSVPQSTPTPAPPRRARTRHRMRTDDSDSINLKNITSYPQCWHRLLEEAKLLFHGYVATRVGFPSKDEGVTEARECLEEVHSRFDEDRVDLEDGTLLVL